MSRLCDFPKCGKKHQAHGYCNGHTSQLRKGKMLTPLKQVNWGVGTIAMDGRKTCSKCAEEQNEDNFHRATHTKDGLASWCKKCVSHCNRLYRFKITEDQFDTILALQNKSCAICLSPKPGGKGTWHVDHDHTCCPFSGKSCGRCIRGILCTNCNIHGLPWYEVSRSLIGSIPVLDCYLNNPPAQRVINL